MVAFRDRTGEEKINKRGKLMKIVKYYGHNDIMVEFPEECNAIVHTTYKRFNAYKTFKEEYIKKVADNHKDYIPEKLYKALYNWSIDIND